MRIIVVTHYFPPETGAPQARLSALAADWAADGDEVTVLTGMPNHPTGVIPPGYRGAIRRRERRDGYRVLRTWLYATPNEGVARKTLGHLSFMVSSVLLGGWASGPADVVVVSSPTFFSIGAGWLLARLKRARLVVEVRDLWPAIFTELGVLTNRRLIRLLERLELAAYAAADTVIVVSDGFRANLICRGVPAAKVHTIRNGVRPGDFDPAAPADPRLRARLGAGPGDCLVLYAGTHGISQGLTTVADAAARLTGDAIRFAFVGEGADKQRLRHRVAELGLNNVTLLPGVPSRAGPGAAGRGGHLPGAAARRAAVLGVHPVEDVRVPRGGQAGGGRGDRRGRADPARGGRLRGAARRQRGAGRRDQGACRRPAAAAGDGPKGPPLRRAALRPAERWPGCTARSWTRPAAGDEAPGRRRQRLYRRLRAARGGRRGHETIALARSQAAARAVAAHGALPLAGDLDDARGLDEVFAAARCEALVCLASLGFGHGPAIVAAAEEAGIRRAVFVSTTAVTTTLHPPTRQVRLAAEQQIRGSGLDWTILRPTMIYGAPATGTCPGCCGC